MKQRTTEQQWKELNPEFQLAIATRFNDGMEKPEFYVDNNCAYIGLYIGEMIEFLDEEHQKGNCFSLSIERGTKGWILWEMGEEKEELCDALWEAVKNVLKK